MKVGALGQRHSEAQRFRRFVSHRFPRPACAKTNFPLLSLPNGHRLTVGPADRLVGAAVRAKMLVTKTRIFHARSKASWPPSTLLLPTRDKAPPVKSSASLSENPFRRKREAFGESSESTASRGSRIQRPPPQRDQHVDERGSPGDDRDPDEHRGDIVEDGGQVESPRNGCGG